MTCCHLTFFCGMDFKHPFIYNKTQTGLEGGKRDLSTVLHSSAKIPFPRTFRQKLRCLDAQQAAVRKMSQWSRCPKMSRGSQPRALRSELTSRWNGPHSSKASPLGVCLGPDAHNPQVRNVSRVPGAEQA